jgi:hypothetical protein
MTAERQAIFDTLQDADEPMSPSDFADTTGTFNQNVRQFLVSMVKADTRRRAGR